MSILSFRPRKRAAPAAVEPPPVPETVTAWDGRQIPAFDVADGLPRLIIVGVPIEDGPNAYKAQIGFWNGAPDDVARLYDAAAAIVRNYDRWQAARRETPIEHHDADSEIPAPPR